MKNIYRLLVFLSFPILSSIGFSESKLDSVQSIQLTDEEISMDLAKIQAKTKTSQPWVLKDVKKGRIDGITYTIKRFSPNWKTDVSSFGIIAIDNGKTKYELEGIYSGNVVFEQPYLTIDAYDDNGYSYLSLIDLMTGKENILVRNNQENGKFFLIKKLSNNSVFVTGINLTLVQSEIPLHESLVMTNKDDFTKINGYHYAYPSFKTGDGHKITYYIIGEINQDILLEAADLFENHVNESLCQITSNENILSKLIQNLIKNYPGKFNNLSKAKCN